MQPRGRSSTAVPGSSSALRPRQRVVPPLAGDRVRARRRRGRRRRRRRRRRCRGSRRTRPARPPPRRRWLRTARSSWRRWRAGPGAPSRAARSSRKRPAVQPRRVRILDEAAWRAKSHRACRRRPSPRRPRPRRATRAPATASIVAVVVAARRRRRDAGTARGRRRRARSPRSSCRRGLCRSRTDARHARSVARRRRCRQDRRSTGSSARSSANAEAIGAAADGSVRLNQIERGCRRRARRRCRRPTNRRSSPPRRPAARAARARCSKIAGSGFGDAGLFRYHERVDVRRRSRSARSSPAAPSRRLFETMPIRTRGLSAVEQRERAVDRAPRRRGTLRRYAAAVARARDLHGGHARLGEQPAELARCRASSMPDRRPPARRRAVPRGRARARARIRRTARSRTHACEPCTTRQRGARRVR